MTLLLVKRAAGPTMGLAAHEMALDVTEALCTPQVVSHTPGVTNVSRRLVTFGMQNTHACAKQWTRAHGSHAKHMHRTAHTCKIPSIIGKLRLVDVLRCVTLSMYQGGPRFERFGFTPNNLVFRF